MTISELGTISEIAASVAVLTTLVFLVIQMRLNTKILIRTNARQATSDSRQALQSILDKEVSEIFLRGNNQGLGSLTIEERYRFDIAMCIWLQSIEQAFADHGEGFYPAEHLVPYQNAVPGFLSSLGGKEWWAERQVWFSPRFRQEVEYLLANHADEARMAGPPK
jgi:hypothetical protein